MSAASWPEMRKESRWTAGERKRPGQPFGRKCAVVRWVCKAVNATWADGCPELRRGLVCLQAVNVSWAAGSPMVFQAVNAAWASGCPELRSNVFTSAGDETVVQMWRVVL